MAREQRDLFRTQSGRGQAVGVARKTLSMVDLPDRGSNQHELNGVAQLRSLVGDERIQNGPIRWYVLSDDEEEPDILDSTYTWYDSRENTPGRTEWRLYYRDPNGLESARSGDPVFLISLRQRQTPELHAYVVEQGSTWEKQISWLFGFDDVAGDGWSARNADELLERAGELSSIELLESLELDHSTARVSLPDLDLVRRRFGAIFPSTRDFSEFAREETDLDPGWSADRALLAWIEREEELFRALEEFIVTDKLEEGFANVDEFISFSLSVHNRRKSRMGYALEHHLMAILDSRSIPYEHNAVTEHNARPDFLFPGSAEYRDPGFPDEQLYMLGAKSTCKDRWRQVLNEADRIVAKHLLTLEPGISEAQTAEMDASGLRLVVPLPLQGTYSPSQQDWVVSLEGFLELVEVPAGPTAR